MSHPDDQPLDPAEPTPEEAVAPELSGAESPEEDISLEQLSDAFNEMMGGDSPDASEEADEASEGSEDAEAEHSEEVEDDDPCPLSPQTILEAMLFVGNPDNEPLQRERVVELIRGVDLEEADELVGELNQQYEEAGAPYEIRSETAGYTLALREEFGRVRDRFHGRARQARLSQAAVEVLALVAYNQPMTSDRVNKLRGHPSGPILSQLVRRELLQMQRPDEKPRAPIYHTTGRFLQLFGLDNLDELPQSQELEK